VRAADIPVAMRPVEIRVAIHSDQDIVLARQEGRALATRLGFSSVDATFIATAISELARNILAFAGKGEITLRVIHGSSRAGIGVVASDQGPGIQDVQLALRDGFSTVGSLGLGLPGVRRLMDEFEIKSRPGRGTTVSVKKWQQ
jgi:serine/threonine-protein kinase RsbT